MDSLHELEELASFLEDFLLDRAVWARLEWEPPDGRSPIVLCQFAGQIDFCDVAADETDRETALEFLFYPQRDGEEPPTVALPVDPENVEVNLLDDGLEIRSLEFCLLFTIASCSASA
ncbi:hypothetical protein [Effusibacillus pohliae]|uniref:hypothetical protein n=1 Tax=Effusibacillus pohliae TaxID=232270 RepID=UPI00036F0170|nr:hypothetical protein [Effusibacillus pohliae]